MGHMRAMFGAVLAQNAKLMELVVAAVEKQTDAVTAATTKQAEVQTTAVTDLFKHMQTLDSRDRQRHEAALEREQGRQLQVYEMMGKAADSKSDGAIALAQATSRGQGMGSAVEGMIQKAILTKIEQYIEGGGEDGPAAAFWNPILDRAGPFIHRLLDGIGDGSGTPALTDKGE
jgi:hypothetical protein